MSHTITTITIIVPTKPKPNISPPRGHIGQQGYPCRHDRPDCACRLIKTSQYHESSKCDLCALRLVVAALPCMSVRDGRGEARCRLCASVVAGRLMTTTHESKLLTSAADRRAWRASMGLKVSWGYRRAFDQAGLHSKVTCGP